MNMNKVKILPPEIVAKIAAGEVVERPASVLKELVENSIDAHATSIEVTLKGAGKTLIQIKDNGTGIGKDDLAALFNRHATSKISTLDNLYEIMSLGFRGEALYSIGAISDITLRGKTKEQEHGWELHLRGNERLSQKPFPMATGTEIEVRELFFNTPARRKFLKSNSSEFNAMLDSVIPYTLLYPRIRFLLTHDEKKIIDLPETAHQLERIGNALHLEPRHMIEEKRGFEGMSAHLVLGDINIQRSRRDMQFIFVNNRPVQNKSISFHLNDMYRRLLSPGVHPFFCVFITIAASEVDVNVHPTKREVKIKNESQIALTLRHFSEELIMAKSKAKQFKKSIFSIPKQEQAPAPEGYSFQTENFAALKASLIHAQPAFSAGETGLSFESQPLSFKNENSLKEKLTQSHYIGNLMSKYLLFETNDSLLVVDQHAAHERINFERLKAQVEKGRIEIQRLLTPVLVKLSHQEIEGWEENKEVIEKMGFDCSLFDKETLAIHAHPRLISQPEKSIQNLLAGDSLDKLDMQTLARLACKSSVTSRYALKKEEAEYHRKQLLLCESPFTCPHGRPTVIEISDDTLEKEFLRK